MNISWTEQVTPVWRDSHFSNEAVGRDKMEKKLTVNASDFWAVLLLEFMAAIYCAVFLLSQTEHNENDINK